MAEERPAKVRKLSHGDKEDELDADSGASDSPEILVDDPTDDTGQHDPRADSGAEAESATGGNQMDAEGKPMSKNQLKKLRKRQEWEAGRDYRKSKRKQKAKEKKERKRAAWEETRANGAEVVQPTSKRPRNPVTLPITFIFDCGFDNLMAEKELISLGSQITRAYSDNARSHYQAHIVVSSWGGKLKERFDTVLNGHYKSWKSMRFMEEGFVEVAEKAKEWMAEPKMNRMAGVFAKHANQKAHREDGESGREPENATEEVKLSTTGQQPSKPADESVQQEDENPKAQQPDSAQQDPEPTIPAETSTNTEEAAQAPQGEVIYLSSDSPYTLEELQPHSTYIIGGLVDKNRHKGICYKIATEKGLRTAKLPISEFMEMQSRSVLATNHVNEIMLRWLECGDWGKAFMQVIPKRKGGRLREAEGGEGEDVGEEGGEESEVLHEAVDGNGRTVEGEGIDL
jgi:tRNA (guanine9-N1)-methyltransferase